jgi:hypothetical protein
MHIYSCVHVIGAWIAGKLDCVNNGPHHREHAGKLFMSSSRGGVFAEMLLLMAPSRARLDDGYGRHHQMASHCRTRREIQPCAFWHGVESPNVGRPLPSSHGGALFLVPPIVCIGCVVCCLRFLRVVLFYSLAARSV